MKIIPSETPEAVNTPANPRLGPAALSVCEANYVTHTAAMLFDLVMCEPLWTSGVVKGWLLKRLLKFAQAAVEALPPLPAGIAELAGARAALEGVRGKLSSEETVGLLQEALGSPSLLVRSAALKVAFRV